MFPSIQIRSRKFGVDRYCDAARSAAVAQKADMKDMKLTAVLLMLSMTAAAANWRNAVQRAAVTGSREKSTLRMMEVQIDSEALGKADGMSWIQLAGDLQQHRRKKDLPGEVSDLLDKKAKSIGKSGASLMKSQNTQMLLNSLWPRR